METNTSVLPPGLCCTASAVVGKSLERGKPVTMTVLWAAGAILGASAWTEGGAAGVVRHGIGGGREIVGEGEARDDDVVVGVEGDFADLVVIGAAEIGGVDQGSFNGFGHVHHADDRVDANGVGAHLAVVRPFQRELSAGGGNAEVDLAVGAYRNRPAFIGLSATQIGGVGKGQAVAIELGEKGVLAAEEHLGVGAVGVGEVGGRSE